MQPAILFVLPVSLAKYLTLYIKFKEFWYDDAYLRIPFGNWLLDLSII